DLVSVTSNLKNNQELDSIGGSNYLAELAGAVPSAANIKYYAEIIQKKSALRKLIASAEHITELGYSEHEELDTVFDQAQHAILNIGNYAKKTFVHLKDTLT